MGIRKLGFFSLLSRARPEDIHDKDLRLRHSTRKVAPQQASHQLPDLVNSSVYEVQVVVDVVEAQHVVLEMQPISAKTLTVAPLGTSEENSVELEDRNTSESNSSGDRAGSWEKQNQSAHDEMEQNEEVSELGVRGSDSYGGCFEGRMDARTKELSRSFSDTCLQQAVERFDVDDYRNFPVGESQKDVRHARKSHGSCDMLSKFSGKGNLWPRHSASSSPARAQIHLLSDVISLQELLGVGQGKGVLSSNLDVRELFSTFSPSKLEFRNREPPDAIDCFSEGGHLGSPSKEKVVENWRGDASHLDALSLGKLPESSMNRVHEWVTSSVLLDYFPLDDSEKNVWPEAEEPAIAGHSKDVLLSEEFSALKVMSDEVVGLDFVTGRAVSHVPALDMDVEHANRLARTLEWNATTAVFSMHGLKVVPAIAAFHHLKSLCLSHNSIGRILSGTLPRGLHVLDLSYNSLTAIEGLRDLIRLRVLNLSYNRLTRIGHGLASCTSIRQLYLAGNKISEIEGLHRLLKLTMLDLSFNKLTSTKAFSQLAANYGSLQMLNLVGNPIQMNLGGDALRRVIIGLVPHLVYLNDAPTKTLSSREVVADRRTVGKPLGSRASARIPAGKKSSAGHHRSRRSSTATTATPKNGSSRSHAEKLQAQARASKAAPGGQTPKSDTNGARAA